MDKDSKTSEIKDSFIIKFFREKILDRESEYYKLLE